MCFKRSLANWAQPRVTQQFPTQRTPARLSRQQTAAQGAINMSRQFQLPLDQMQAHLAAGEQIQLLVWLDQFIGIQGPGAAWHVGLHEGGATLAESLGAEKPREPLKASV